MMNFVSFNRLPFFRISIFCLLIIFGACKSKKQAAPKEDLLRNIYFDYNISADADYDKLTLKLKFLEDDDMGDAIQPEGLQSVKLDNEMLQPDSTKMNGVYYEVQKPINDFAGNHRIEVETVNGQTYTETFKFAPFTLTTALPETIKKEDLPLDFSGLEKKDMIRLVLTDTSFSHNGINRMDSVSDNHYILSKADLQKLSNGPVIMEIAREYKRPIKKGDESIGVFRIDCTLRRSFNLVE